MNLWIITLLTHLQTYSGSPTCKQITNNIVYHFKRIIIHCFTLPWKTNSLIKLHQVNLNLVVLGQYRLWESVRTRTECQAIINAWMSLLQYVNDTCWCCLKIILWIPLNYKIKFTKVIIRNNTCRSTNAAAWLARFAWKPRISRLKSGTLPHLLNT